MSRINELAKSSSGSGEDEREGMGGQRPVNVSEWIAHAIADSGTTVVYGTR